MRFVTNYLPSANLGSPYNQKIEVVDFTSPVTFTTASDFPGVTLSSSGTLSGVPTKTGVFSLTIRAVDSAGSTVTGVFPISVTQWINLSQFTVDQSQYVAQFEQVLARRGTWSTGLTSTTSQTLIEFISTVGAFNSSKIIRAKEDAFADTAQSDSAIRSIANMQGLRLNRKLPSTISVELICAYSETIPIFTQFTVSGTSWFNTEYIELASGVKKPVTLKEGLVKMGVTTGLGTELQTWVSPEDSFVVSDQDVAVFIDSGSSPLTKTTGGLWGFKDQPAYSDRTLSDGRLVIQFGSNGFGSIPQTTETVTILYAVTKGAAINGYDLSTQKINATGYADVLGTVSTNPTGGSDEKPAIAYKNFSAGAFGTFSSAVTKSQYLAIAGDYPGVLDAVTLSQREINPYDVKFMNCCIVSALTTSDWSTNTIQEYLNYLQENSMYSTRFIWLAPVEVPRTIELVVNCFNSVLSLTAIENSVTKAIQNLISKRPGILATNFYHSDLITAANGAAPGQISWTDVIRPTSSMVVTLPKSPSVSYEVSTTGGSLGVGTYAYAISVNARDHTGTVVVEGTPTNWINPQVSSPNSSIVLKWADSTPDVTGYVVWGRGFNGKLGILGTTNATTKTYTDMGTITPSAAPDTDLAELAPHYNSISDLKVTAKYASRQIQAMLPVRSA